ncbi:MAG: glycosyltransferase family 4 protein [Vallitaleaceae bacterium]|jgi:1,2-diacylglycerol-3-alpha-glucose alpha-1,2-galactosyltransferase|nr:glycosyltransferase family 4 protein [Vallitaleaceae bacterium]
MKRINMMSSADRVEGQGVGSATKEQVNLVMESLDHDYEITKNQLVFEGINHYHTIDFRHFLHMVFSGKKNAKVGSVHFLPETIEGSIKLPFGIRHIFYRYIIRFYKTMDYLVTVNPYFMERLVAQGINREKVHYIPNYVSKDEFYPMKRKGINQIKASYGIDTDQFVVLGVGQIQTRKGVLDFIEIAKDNPEMTFVWAGGFSFGKITDGYDALKKVTKNPPSNVKFIGIVNRSKMNSLYNMADVLFMPSYNELFPMSILEAMNCKTPLLLRDIPIYEGILNGYYIKADDNEAFSNELRALSNDEIYYRTASHMSKKGSDFYSKEHVLVMWEAFYQKVYEEKLGSMTAKDSKSINGHNGKKHFKEKVVS